MAFDNNEKSNGAVLAVVAVIVFSAMEKILPDVVRWVSFSVDGVHASDDALRVAIGCTGLISVGMACVAARASDQPFPKTVAAVVLAVILTAHALVKSSEGDNGSLDFGAISDDLYIVLVFFVLYLLVFREARGENSGSIGWKVISTAIGAVIGFLIGMMLVFILDFVQPDFSHENVRFIVQPQATVALATAWGMAVAPLAVNSSRSSIHGTVVYLAAALLLGFGYGFLAYTPDWYDTMVRPGLNRLLLGSITLCLTAPAVIAAVVFANVCRSRGLQLNVLILVGAIAVLVFVISMTVYSLVPIKAGISQKYIRDLMILGATVLPFLAAVGIQLSIQVANRSGWVNQK